jgi:DNA helicase II / ATP-dependent DNA helicase PcrA
MANHLDGLNEPQRQAVLHTNGPLMIIAGAGSGKTRVLTHRITNLMEKRVDAFRIMALTFTNKAAGEMRNRIEKLVGTEARNLWMGTFHSIFARILRFEADKIGYTSNFSIYDTDDSKALVKSILKERNLDDKTYKPASVFNRISSLKNKLISYKEYNQNGSYYEDDRARNQPEFGKIYETYQRRCFQANAMDFDDLLYITNVLFRDFPEVLQKYQQKFQYLLIDEFQDTNYAQYLICKRLSEKHRNICVVGDDAQSIYAFRGADIQNILNFERDYSELQVIRLEQNYRSTKTIVEAANSVIAKNQKQLKKNVWTDNEAGQLIKVVKAVSDSEEGRIVADTIFEEKVNFGLHNLDFAILYRTNAQSRAMEEALRKKNIKYRVIGGLSFYQRKEIKDLIAYMRYSVNHQDEEAFKRIINLPKRGIGDSTVEKIVTLAGENNTSVWGIISHIKTLLAGRAVSAIEDFVKMIQNFADTAQIKDAYTTATMIAKQSGILKELYDDKTIEGLARYENVQELLNAIKEFTDNPENQADKSLSVFLQQVSLLTSADDNKDDDPDKVTLMTIHAAKGLEFKHVFVVGMEENLFPSQMMLASRQDLEEERRLFYVAVTRAEKKLTLTYATTRYYYGRLQNCEPSRFLAEIDAKYLKNEKVWNRLTETEFNTSFVKNLTQKPKPTVKTTYKPSIDFKASDTKNLQAGMKVEHQKFGFGVVKEIQNFSGDRKATIDFKEHGEKVLLLSFAKLQIHS